MRPTLLRRAAASSRQITPAEENHFRPRTLAYRQWEKLPEDRKPTALLLHEVPKCALPTDVLRALRDSRAVTDDFPLSYITPSPISLPRRPSLTTTYHLTLSTPQLTSSVYRLLSTQPLFPTSSSRPISGTYARSGSTHNTLNLRDPLRIQLVDASAEHWVGTQLRAVEAQSEREAERRTVVAFNVNVQKFDRDWVGARGMSGRRVVVKGLPPGMPVGAVREMARAYGLEEGFDAVIQLPQTPGRRHSIHALTADSVASAYRLVRRLHMVYHTTRRGENVLLRAEVVW